jgi:peptide-methionine (S)-S-oxide reductase
LPGVIRTRVGYAGGSTDSPTYTNLGDHTESIEIVYDPEQISYADLLAVFWDSHSPVSRPFSQQYKSIIFFHDEEQREMALSSKKAQESERETELYTEVVPAATFYPAEDYHQKYRLRNTAEFMAEFQVLYPDEKDFVASTTAARVNGYLGGYGSLDQLRSEREEMGLSPEAIDSLMEIVTQRGGRQQ